jgi:hypothetical protein
VKHRKLIAALGVATAALIAGTVAGSTAASAASTGVSVTLKNDTPDNYISWFAYPPGDPAAGVILGEAYRGNTIHRTLPNWPVGYVIDAHAGANTQQNNYVATISFRPGTTSISEEVLESPSGYYWFNAL